MAVNYFNELSLARGLPFRAISRGTTPDSTTVPPTIVHGLRNDGFDVSGYKPAALTAADVTASGRMILIDTDLASNMPNPSKAPEKWIDVPPASVNYEAAREALKTHVANLLDRLSAERRLR